MTRISLREEFFTDWDNLTKEDFTDCSNSDISLITVSPYLKKERGWSTHGNEESSSEEAGQEGGREEEEIVFVL